MSSTDAGRVSHKINGHVCTITVENESKKNSYTPAMLDRLAEHLTAYEDDDDSLLRRFVPTSAFDRSLRKRMQMPA